MFNVTRPLMQMKDVSYPFSIFWKWHILSDTSLAAQFPCFIEATNEKINLCKI
jgi:hypothetical protein